MSKPFSYQCNDENLCTISIEHVQWLHRSSTMNILSEIEFCLPSSIYSFRWSNEVWFHGILDIWYQSTWSQTTGRSRLKTNLNGSFLRCLEWLVAIFVSSMNVVQWIGFVNKTESNILLLLTLWQGNCHTKFSEILLLLWQGSCHTSEILLLLWQASCHTSQILLLL